MNNFGQHCTMRYNYDIWSPFRGVCLVSKVKLVLFAEPRQRIHIRMQDLHVWKASTSEKRREISYSLLYGRLDICFNRNRLFPTFFYCRIVSTATPKEDLESVGLNDFQIQHFFSIHFYFWKVMRHVMNDGMKNTYLPFFKSEGVKNCSALKARLHLGLIRWCRFD